MFIQATHINKTYQVGSVPFKALDQVDFNMNESEIAVILGPSGSGKSTLLNILGGIDRADNGTIEIDGTDIVKLNDKKLTEYRKNQLGFIFQFYNLIPNLTVYENVEIAANICKEAMGVDEILEAVGMLDKKNHFPRELSGGQQQRVSIARALVKKPKLLLCDEPTGALDYNTSKDILKLLENMNKKYKTTIIIITHNTALADMANKIIKLRSGVICEERVNDKILCAERIEW